MRAGRLIALFLTAGMIFGFPSFAGHSQAPGWFRYALGDFTVTALQDGTINIPATAYQGLAAEQIQSLFGRAFALSAKGSMPTSINAYLIDTGTQRILVDGGNADCYGFNTGGLPANLKAAGYAPQDIDIIVITHLHGDHVCGLAKDGKRLFSKAVVWVAAEEAAYWLDGNNPALPKPVRPALALYGKDFRTFKAGETIAPGMTIVPAHGHTPGHTAFLFESKGATLLVWGDIVHNHLLQFAHPEAFVGSDVDRTEAIATRKALFAKLTAENTAIAGAHLPFPGIGRLRKDGDGYVFVPVEFSPQP